MLDESKLDQLRNRAFRLRDEISAAAASGDEDTCLLLDEAERCTERAGVALIAVLDILALGRTK